VPANTEIAMVIGDVTEQGEQKPGIQYCISSVARTGVKCWGERLVAPCKHRRHRKADMMATGVPEMHDKSHWRADLFLANQARSSAHKNATQKRGV